MPVLRRIAVFAIVAALGISAVAGGLSLVADVTDPGSEGEVVDPGGDGSTDGGSTGGTDGGSTDGGSTGGTDGGSTDGGSTGGTDGGSTDGGSTGGTDPDVEERGTFASVVAECAPRGKDPRLAQAGYRNHGAIVSRAAKGLTITMLGESYDLGTRSGVDALCAAFAGMSSGGGSVDQGDGGSQPAVAGNSEATTKSPKKSKKAGTSRGRGRR